MPNQRLLCDISRSGQLLELGVDPLARPDLKSLGVQTETSSWTAWSEQLPHAGAGLDAESLEGDGLRRQAAAGQVLRLATGLLGLELHEKPNCWAEVWLNFQGSKLLPQLGLEAENAQREIKRTQVEWQQKVLSHLKASKVSSRVEQPEGFEEHLELADFALKRITHAVNILQNPRQERALILEQYTEGRVEEVCQDLSQWLERLALAVSVYHVHLLDLESDNRRCGSKVTQLESKLKETQLERDDARRRFLEMEAKWSEEKMKRRAEALFGVKTTDENPKIYSQSEVDDFYDQWKKEQVDPLLEEIKSLRKAQRDLMAKMQAMKQNQSTSRVVEDLNLLGQKEVTLLQSALAAASQRSYGDLGRLLTRLGDTLATGSFHELPEIVRAIQALPLTEPLEMAETGSQVEDNTRVGKEELEQLQLGLKAAGPHVPPELGTLLQQLGQNMAEGAEMKKVVASIQRLPVAPREVLAAPARPEVRSFGTNTTQAVVLPSKPAQEKEAVPEHVDSRDFEGELRRLREQLEAQILAAQKEAEKQRLRAEEALKRLEEEMKKAEQLIAELRRKLKELEALLQKAGLGKQVAELFAQAGLADFLKGRDVFERLYRDALRRMRSQAEVQARLTEESSQLFLRTLQDLSSHPLVAVDAAMELHAGQLPLQVLRFLPPEMEGDSAQLVPSQPEKGRPVRFKTTSALVDEPLHLEVKQLTRAATTEVRITRCEPSRSPSPPTTLGGNGGRSMPRGTSPETMQKTRSLPGRAPEILRQASKGGASERSDSGSPSRASLARPLAAAHWPLGAKEEEDSGGPMAVEGHSNFLRAGSEESSPSRSSPSPAREAHHEAHTAHTAYGAHPAQPAKPAQRPSAARYLDDLPLLAVSAIGPRPAGPSQLLPKKEKRGGQKRSSDVLRSAGSLAMPGSLGSVLR